MGIANIYSIQSGYRGYHRREARCPRMKGAFSCISSAKDRMQPGTVLGGFCGPNLIRIEVHFGEIRSLRLPRRETLFTSLLASYSDLIEYGS